MALVLSTGQSFARAACMGHPSTWNDCFRSVTDADGNNYVGTFTNGAYAGEGTYREANGNVYTGNWQNGVFHGEGVRSSANGAKYTGAYRDGLRHGAGTYISPAGMTYVGEFKNGKFNFLELTLDQALFDPSKFQNANDLLLIFL